MLNQNKTGPATQLVNKLVEEKAAGRIVDSDNEDCWEDGLKVPKVDLVFRKMLADAIQDDIYAKMNDTKKKKKKHVFGSSPIKPKEIEAPEYAHKTPKKPTEDTESISVDLDRVRQELEINVEMDPMGDELRRTGCVKSTFKMCSNDGFDDSDNLE